MDTGPQRRLAAIVSGDVVGYSRLMQADEAGTLERLKARLDSVVRPEIDARGGRLVKLMGDGLLAEFPSVVGATEWAIAVQRAFAGENAHLPAGQRIEYRVGVNLGDVIVDGEDIFGDGVNVAARLQATCDVGGVCLSDDAFRQVRGKVPDRFADGGEVSLKNIAGQVRVWRWSPDQELMASFVDVTVPVPGFNDRPAIAVLSFNNMSNDPEQEFLGDGIAEDILTRLAMWRWLPVIARNSSFSYKGQSVDMKSVGQDLGARYILEGSVRKAGNRIRITGQLIDTETGHHTWAERYDRDLDDIFAIQDEITEAIVTALEPAVGRAEMTRALRKTPTDLDAWGLYQRGMSQLVMATRDGLESARELFRRSAELDPTFASPLAGIVVADFIDNTLGFTTDMAAMMTSAPRDAMRAVSLDDLDPFAHAALAYAGFSTRQHETAIAAGRRAIELNPSYALGYHALSAALFANGDLDEAIDMARTAIRISPNDPFLFLFLGVLSASYYLRRDYAQSAETSAIAIRRFPWYASTLRWHAMAQAQLGRMDEAQASLSRFLELAPSFTLKAAVRSYAFRRQTDLDHYLEGLRLAGLPE